MNIAESSLRIFFRMNDCNARNKNGKLKGEMRSMASFDGFVDCILFLGVVKLSYDAKYLVDTNIQGDKVF